MAAARSGCRGICNESGFFLERKAVSLWESVSRWMTVYVVCVRERERERERLKNAQIVPSTICTQFPLPASGFTQFHLLPKLENENRFLMWMVWVGVCVQCLHWHHLLISHDPFDVGHMCCWFSLLPCQSLCVCPRITFQSLLCLGFVVLQSEAVKEGLNS